MIRNTSKIALPSKFPLVAFVLLKQYLLGLIVIELDSFACPLDLGLVFLFSYN